MVITPKLIIGLGNPDKEYQNTYHNVGFLFIDYLAKAKIDTSGVLAIKSEVYMNLSGNFVLTALKKHNAEPDELLLVHDDSDLEIGKYKLSFSRGAAGHHGVESVIKSLRTKNFWRLRIGIRPKTDQRSQQTVRNNLRLKAEKFVLKKISKTNLEILETAFSKIISELRLS